MQGIEGRNYKVINLKTNAVSFLTQQTNKPKPRQLSYPEQTLFVQFFLYLEQTLFVQFTLYLSLEKLCFSKPTRQRSGLNWSGSKYGDFRKGNSDELNTVTLSC